MSSALLFLQKIANGQVTLTDGTSAPDRVVNGMPLLSNGAVAVDTVGAVASFSQGLPITVNGRIAYVVGGADPYEYNGLIFSGGKLTGVPLPFVPDPPDPPGPPVTYEVGDLAFSLVALTLPWLPVNATYAEATYPELAALFTVTDGNFTVPDQDGGDYLVYIYSGVEA